MNLRLILLGCVALAALPACSTSPNAPTAAAADHWTRLFDGTTLAGWRGLKSETPPDGWIVEDGAIKRTHKSGDLVTQAEFGDFELEIQWKVERATNSGIIYRVGLDEDTTWRTGPEYQLLDNVDGADRHKPSHLAGSLYDIVAPTRDVTRAVGEWNDTRIKVVGWHVEHWLNGVKIVDVDLGSPEGKALVAASKFHTMPHFATLLRGHIALQDHDNGVWFRNIRIKQL